MIKWNEYTWYSKLAAALFFIFVLPAWTFYIGTQYRQAQESLEYKVPVTPAPLNKNQPVSIVGEYQTDDAKISVTKTNAGKYYIIGNAWWQGQNEAQYNVGDIDGELKVYGNTGTYDDGNCIVEFAFSKDKLTAKDNLACGGLNVSFTGDYVKK